MSTMVDEENGNQSAIFRDWHLNVLHLPSLWEDETKLKHCSSRSRGLKRYWTIYQKGFSLYRISYLQFQNRRLGAMFGYSPGYNLRIPYQAKSCMVKEHANRSCVCEHKSCGNV